MDPQSLLDRLLEDGVFTPLLFACTLVVIILIRSLTGVLKTMSRERTRREIAAFIAEGSMSPEQGERLMRAGKDAES